MPALVSRLPSPFQEEIQSLWAELDQLFGLAGPAEAYFAWQFAAGYDLAQLEPALRQIAAATRPFSACTTGVGVFTGEQPVIYIPLVKTTVLMDLHARLWVQTQAAAEAPDPAFSPSAWMPHIRLVDQSLDAQKLVDVMQYLAFRSFAWEMAVDHLAVLDSPGDYPGEVFTSLYPFQEPIS